MVLDSLIGGGDTYDPFNCENNFKLVEFHL